MDLPAHQASDVTILLVGQTGHRKSSLGNSLLGKNKFEAKMSPESVTKVVGRVESQIHGRRIEIVDCPGLEDVEEGSEYAMKHLKMALFGTIPGFNAIFFVMYPDRFTESIEKSVNQFLTFFGKDVKEFAFIVFTHVSDERKLQEYLEVVKKSQNKRLKVLRSLIDKCGDKILHIDNDLKGSVKAGQVNKILAEIDNNVERLQKPYYTNSMFKKAVDIAENYIHEQEIKRRESEQAKQQAIRGKERKKCEKVFDNQRRRDTIKQREEQQAKEQAIRNEKKKHI